MGRPDIGPDRLLMVLTDLSTVDVNVPPDLEGTRVMMPLWGPTKEAAIAKGTVAAMTAAELGVTAVLVEFRWTPIDDDHTDTELRDHGEG
jgi:hypothetical protein